MSPRARRRGSGSGSGRNRRKGKGQPRLQTGAGFWGDPAKLPEPRSEVRISDDAAAVPRSLGPPPLTGHEAIVEHYFAAVYDRAVTLAGAVATAGGLITPDELAEELED